jgi:hypothetical protein
MECTSESLGAFLASRCSSVGILPLQIGGASTIIYFLRGVQIGVDRVKVTLLLRGAD